MSAWRNSLLAALFTVMLLGGRSWADPRDNDGNNNAGGANNNGGVDVSEVGQWAMDRVVLADGRVIAGLVRHEGDRFVEIVEIGRKPGQPMYLLVRWLLRSQVAEMQRLPPPLRRELQQRIARFRNRTAILAAKHQQLELTRRRIGDNDYLHYQGPWFSLASTAEDYLTREAIVRIEQMFAGYRTFLRPRKSRSQPLRLILLNSIDEYHAYQQRWGLDINHPAYFDPRRNEIVAGGELARLAGRLQEIRRHHQSLLGRYKRLERELQQKLTALTKTLEDNGADEEQLRQIRIAARREWKELADAQALKIRLAERQNDALLQEKFRLLYHEAFHAYLQNYVYEEVRYDIPRWLNEGWAQVFESGLLDAGTLRLDAPDAALLAGLQDRLRGDRQLSLVDLLRAPDREFVVGHRDLARRSEGLYLYSWGVAYHLTFHMQLLDSPAMDEYLDRETGPADPVRRFEKLVGMTIDAYQEQWAKDMLNL